MGLRLIRPELLSRRYARVILGAAAVIRLIFLVFFPASVWGSGRRYVDPASNFISGHWGAASTIDQLPGAPLFFVPFFILFGERYLPVVIGQHILGLAGLYCLMSFAQKAWGDRAAAFAGVLLTIQFILPYQEAFLLSETVGQFWSSAALFLAGVLRFGGPARPRFWALGGAAAAMAALSRGEYVFLGPLAGLMLALPDKNVKTYPWRGLLAFLGVWGLFIGGWTLRNTMLGFPDFNPHGPTVLLDTALPLVRWDLPTEPLVKRILKEQRDFCEEIHCDPRPTTLLRLEKEYGYTFLEARKMVGRVAREAVFTQPLAFLPMVWQNFLTFFRPIAWVSDEAYDQRSPIKESLGDSRARRAFWKAMEAGPQYAGWAAVALALFAPLLFFTAGPRGRWGAAMIILAAVCVAGTASLFRAVARTQADLYLPLGVAGAFAVDAVLRSARAESSKD